MIINPTARISPAAGYTNAEVGVHQMTGDRAFRLFSGSYIDQEELGCGKIISVNEKLHGQHFVVHRLRNSVSHEVVAVYTASDYSNGHRLSVCHVASKEAEDFAVSMYMQCGGTTYSDFENVRDVASAEPAADLYALENYLFKEQQHIGGVMAVSEISPTAAKKLAKNSKQTPLDYAESVDLLKRMAKDYAITNLTIEKSAFDGKVAGRASPMTATVFERAVTPKMQLCDNLLFDTIIIHEFAHIVDFVRYGTTGHGNRFRKLYQELLRRYIPACEDIEIFLLDQ